MPGRKPQLPEPFTIERAVPLMDEAGVDRAVGRRVVLTGGASQLQGVRDLAGRRLAIGAKGSGTHSLAMRVLVANGTAKAPTRLLELGADDYVRKPVDFVQFAEEVTRLARRWLKLDDKPSDDAAPKHPQ